MLALGRPPLATSSVLMHKYLDDVQRDPKRHYGHFLYGNTVYLAGDFPG